MDPNANLRESLKLAQRIIGQFDHEEPIDENDAARLADLVLALDRWIVQGGFLPAQWSSESCERSDHESTT